MFRGLVVLTMLQRNVSRALPETAVKASVSSSPGASSLRGRLRLERDHVHLWFRKRQGILCKQWLRSKLSCRRCRNLYLGWFWCNILQHLSWKNPWLKSKSVAEIHILFPKGGGGNKKFCEQYWRQIFHKKHCSTAARPSSQSKHRTCSTPHQFCGHQQ